MTEEFKPININNINLDLDNPRVPLSIRNAEQGQTKEQVNNDILEYLIKTGSITELILSIGENGFFSGEALLLIPDPNDEGKYIVVEGNRRVTALKLLHDPSLATVSKNKILEASNSAKKSTDELTMIPSIIFPERKDILKYLGYRHITGIKDWKALEKARYMYTMYQQLKDDGSTEDNIHKEIAKSIGSNRPYVKRILQAYNLYLFIEQKDFFDIEGLDDQKFHFVNLSDSLHKPNVSKFLLEDNEEANSPFNEKHLKEWTEWLFKENASGKTRLKGTSSDLKDLDQVLANTKALEIFRNKDATLAEAVFLAEDAEHIIRVSLEEALKSLLEIDRVISKVEDFNKIQNFDENLLELRQIAKKIHNFKLISIDNDL
ncbi:MAG TPA: hypothetical protein ENK66_08860 [Arcobacter sp.]|nr:hypothetical protein [Arcobacter sp.]